MSFDSTVSIGGQSLLDGVWRILQPALQSLTNPLPITLPGMTDAWVRITSITPSLDSATSPPARLKLLVNVEARGNILLTASVKSGTINLALPTADITIPRRDAPALRGDLHLPTTPIDVTLPRMTGTLPAPVAGSLTLRPVDASGRDSAGSLTLPMGGTFDLPPISGVLEFVHGTVGDVGLPLPSVVPLALDLTPTSPATFSMTLDLSVISPFDRTSAFGLLLRLQTPRLGPIVSFADAAIFATAIEDGLGLLLAQLGVTLHGTPAEPFVDVGPTVAAIRTTATNIAAAAQAAIENVLKDALSGLTARTGRLMFPTPAPGSACDVALLPTDARAQFSLTSGAPVLQIGFDRPGTSTEPLTFPDFAPSDAADVEVKIGNDFLLELLACLVEKLPNFTFHGGSTPTHVDVRNCRNWSGVTLEIWPLVVSGTLSVCIVGASGTPRKTVELVGDFIQSNSLGAIGVKFTLTLDLQLNDLAAVTGLRLVNASTEPIVAIDGWMYGMLIGAGVVSLLVPGMLVLLIAVPLILMAWLRQQLLAVVDTLISRAHALTSPVAVPPGVFEAFGRLVPVSIMIDDLTAQGVLTTPTSPWALTPIAAFPSEHEVPGGGQGQPPFTHVTAEPK